MHEEPVGVWRCFAHGTAAWEAARAMGAAPPCRVPLSARAVLRLARQYPVEPGTAQMLASEPEDVVRHAVASDPTCTPTILHFLARDASSVVREAVASHPSTPPEELVRLVEDSEFMVQSLAVRNPSMPTDVLEHIVSSSDGAAPDRLLQMRAAEQILERRGKKSRQRAVWSVSSDGDPAHSIASQLDRYLRGDGDE